MRVGTPLLRRAHLVDGGCGQFPRSTDGACEQRHSGDDKQLAILTRGKGETENTAEIFDGNHVCSEDVWNANRIDECETHNGDPSQELFDAVPCNSFGGLSIAVYDKNAGVNIHGYQTFKLAEAAL